MTEPDLVTVDDYAAVDNASLTAHVNSRGVFDLHPLHVGRGAVMRSHSRLMAGASVGAFSTLLEHTLVVSGDATPPGSVWQGWPASPSRVGAEAAGAPARRPSRLRMLWSRLFRSRALSRKHSDADVTELLLGEEEEEVLL